MKLSGIGVWNQQLRYGDRVEAADAAAELDELGYTALWIPDVGGAVFDAVDELLAATRHAVVATGILNLWMHEPAETAARFHASSAEHGARFLLGIGVSHAPLVDADDPGRYRKPLTAMAAFLDGLSEAPAGPVPAGSVVLAALGPKMLKLAAEQTGGVHPYLVTPEHTHEARQAVGANALVLPEQTAILCSNRDEARAIGADWLRQYLTLPNYANSVRRLGFTAVDIDTVSDRLFDALIAWGDEEAVLRRVGEHQAAGADHVCVQVLTSTPKTFPRPEWRRIAAAMGQPT